MLFERVLMIVWLLGGRERRGFYDGDFAIQGNMLYFKCIFKIHSSILNYMVDILKAKYADLISHD